VAYVDPQSIRGQSTTPTAPAYARPLQPAKVKLGDEIDAAPGPWFAPGRAEGVAAGPMSTRPPTGIAAASVEGSSVTVHQVRLGPETREITVSRSAGVQVGDHIRQLNHYRFKLDRPKVSLDQLLKGHPARLRSLARLAANPRSWVANFAFRQHLSARPQLSSRVLFAGPPGGRSVRIRARVDEHGATVVENSRGVQVMDHGVQRNDFKYELADQEISLERMLRDRPDLVRGLAMTVRHPGNPAVQRSFTRQVSGAYTHGSAPSLRMLNQDWRGRSLAIENRAAVQVGTNTSRTDRVSVDIRRAVLTGWEATAERIAAELDPPAAPWTPVDGRAAVPSPASPRVVRREEPPVAHRDPPLPPRRVPRPVISPPSRSTRDLPDPGGRGPGAGPGRF
jgi:hypothetical protein